MRGNTIKMSLSERKVAYPKDHEELYQYDYGQKLVLEGVALPTTYEVHFSNNEHGESVTQLGDSTGVNIPDMLLTTGQKIYVWVYLHNDSTDGETVYRGVIPVNERAKPTDAPPTPVQQSIVEEAIVALNDGVEQVEQAVANVGQDIQDALTEAKESGEFDGPKGDPGDNAYVYIRYSATEPSSDQDMKTEPDKWIGIYSGHADSAPTHYTDYTWYMFKGETVDISGKADKLDTVLDSTLSHGRKANTTVGRESIAYGDNVEASGMYSQAFGLSSVASATSSHAEGRGTHATGAYSHAEGSGNTASGECSHVEGCGNTSSGVRAHAEGSNTTASGHYSHAEGSGAVASEEYSHAEGGGTKAQGYGSHAEGGGTKASGSSSHSEGGGTTASGNYSHSEGGGTTASGEYSHAEGSSSQSIGMASHAEGSSTKASGYSSHAEGTFTEANGSYSHAGGANTKATRRSQTVFGEYNVYETGDPSTRGSYVEIVGNGAYNAHSNARALDWQGNEYLMGDVYVGCGISSTNGTKLAKLTDLPDISGKADKLDTVLETTLSRGRKNNTTVGDYSIAFGDGVESTGDDSVAFGFETKATNDYANAEGYGTTASGNGSHAEGGETVASGTYAHAEGTGTNASAASAHAEGQGTTASGNYAHAEGSSTVASGIASHAEGHGNTAYGKYSHVGGVGGFASGQSSFSHGNGGAQATGNGAWAGGQGTQASGENSIAHGGGSRAEDYGAVAVGMGAAATGKISFAQGSGVEAIGACSHVVGEYNVIDRSYYDSLPEWEPGTYVVGAEVKKTSGLTVKAYRCKTANSDETFDPNHWDTGVRGDKVFIIGNGVSGSGGYRSNAMAVGWDGDVRINGDVYAGCNADSTGGSKLAKLTDIPTIPVTDVQVNSTSILNNGVAEIPVANANSHGVVKVSGGNRGIEMDNGFLQITYASSGYIKNGSDARKPIVPYTQHEAAFYGLAKAAGVDLANENVTLGQFPDNAKAAIAQMLGLGQIYGPMEEIVNVVISQDSEEVNVMTDKYGNPFKLAHAQITLMFGTEAATTNDYISAACFDSQGLKRGMPTLRLINGSKCWMVHNFVSFGGIAFCLGKSSSSGNTQTPQLATFNDSNSTYGMTVKNMPYITGVQFKQYTASTTPIIAGSRVVIYGCRVIE